MLAIAAAIYIKRTEMFDMKGKIKHFIEKHFGYNLDIDIREIRQDYTFDVTCQESFLSPLWHSYKSRIVQTV